MCVFLFSRGLTGRAGQGRAQELLPFEEPEKVQLWMLETALNGGSRKSPEWEVMRSFQEPRSNKSPSTVEAEKGDAREAICNDHLAC